MMPIVQHNMQANERTNESTRDDKNRRIDRIYTANLSISGNVRIGNSFRTALNAYDNLQIKPSPPLAASCLLHFTNSASA